jgi:hypothetical protein
VSWQPITAALLQLSPFKERWTIREQRARKSLLIQQQYRYIVSVGLKQRKLYSGDDRSAAQLSFGCCAAGKNAKGERRVALLTDEGIE